MLTSRNSLFIVAILASLTGATQAQGPWPTMNQPSLFSPVREFFTPRAYTSNYNPPATSSPMYGSSPSTPIIPGVPQCANGRCRQSCPNGQCSNGSSCANGQCRQNTNCPNGQCGPGQGVWNKGGYGVLGSNRPAMPNTSIGLRPLTPSSPNNLGPRPANLNRLIPLDAGAPNNGGYYAPQGPMSRNRESMSPHGQDFTLGTGVRLR